MVAFIACLTSLWFTGGVPFSCIICRYQQFPFFCCWCLSRIYKCTLSSYSCLRDKSRIVVMLEIPSFWAPTIILWSMLSLICSLWLQQPHYYYFTQDITHHPDEFISTSERVGLSNVLLFLNVWHQFNKCYFDCNWLVNNYCAVWMSLECLKVVNYPQVSLTVIGFD